MGFVLQTLGRAIIFTIRRLFETDSVTLVASVELWVVLTTLLLVLRFILDFFGPWYANRSMLAVVLAIEMLNYSLVHYTLGLMQLSAARVNDYFQVWAVLLVTLQYSVKIGRPYSRSKQIPLLDLMSSFWAANLLRMQTMFRLRIPLWLIWALNAARIISYFSSSDKAGAINQENTRLVSDYMSYEHKVGKPEQTADVANPDKEFTMEGHKYLVLGEDLALKQAQDLALKRAQDEGTEYMIRLDPDKQEGLITVEKIWNADAQVRRLLWGSAPDPANKLKDVCVSFALYKLLRRRFYDLPIHEARGPGQEKMKRLVFEYITENRERAFRVAAVELSFLQDLFYSKHAAMFADGFPTGSLLLSLSLVAATGYIAYPVRYIPERMDQADRNRITHGVFITRLIVALIVGKELAEICTYVFSQWTKVLILCSYARRRCSHHPVVEAAHEDLVEKSQKKQFQHKNSWSSPGLGLWLVPPLSRAVLIFMTRGEWDQRIRQHNLLISYCGVKVVTSRKPIRIIYRETSRTLYRETSRVYILPSKFPVSIKLEECTMEAIFMSFKKLKENPERLASYFSIAFGSNEAFMQKLTWAVKLEADTHRILVWHIATSLCEIHVSSKKTKAHKIIGLDPRPFVKKPKGTHEAAAWWKHYTTAASLSNYCAYLVTQALLPDNGLVANRVFREVRLEINRATMDGSLFRLRSMEDVYNRLMEMPDEGEEPKEERAEMPDEREDPQKEYWDHINNSLAWKGARLGKQLLKEYGEDRVGLWRDLSEFWTGFLLHLAAGTRAAKHRTRLAGSRELLTHLWALLSHAGFLGKASHGQQLLDPEDLQDVNPLS